MPETIELSWDDVDKLCDEVVNQIESSKRKFNCISAVQYGGIIPASIIAYKLKINRPIFFLDSKDIVYNNYPVADGELLIDDVCDTGRTLTQILLDVSDMQSCASLIYKSWSTIKPAFYGMITESWIKFPWERV